MAHVNRRIGKSSETAIDTADGTGGGVLDAFIHDYFQRSGNVYNFPGTITAGITASGGIINDYASGPAVYRAHIFTSSGTFNVTSLSNDPVLPNSVDYLVIAGGGGGGQGNGGGGGAGGLRSTVGTTGGGGSLESAIPISNSPGSYTITVGGGGAGQRQSAPQGVSMAGSNSSFTSPLSPQTVTSTGGGRGNNEAGGNGGCGGGGGPSDVGGSGTAKSRI